MANLSEEKARFIRKMQDSATLLARVLNEMHDMFVTSQARGYYSGGPDEIEDADIADTGVTASEAFSGLTLCENLPKFIDNASPFAADYRPIVSQLRTDM